VKGYDDGTVCLWDYRNPKVEHINEHNRLLSMLILSFQTPVLSQRQEDLGPIVHTTFENSSVICYGKRGLTFMDISGVASD